MRTLIAGLALAGSAALAHAQATTTEGEVRKVDTAQRKITLKHGEIKNLDMPPMSMVFAVKDPALLGKVQGRRQGALRRRQDRRHLHRHGDRGRRASTGDRARCPCRPRRWPTSTTSAPGSTATTSRPTAAAPSGARTG